jgi:hypothetical protein
MIIPLIDMLVALVVIPVFVFSVVVFGISLFLILRNVGARVSVVRAIVVSPALLVTILETEAIRNFLLASAKLEHTEFSDEEIEGVLRFLLLSQARRLTRENIATEDRITSAENTEIEFRLFQKCIIALRQLIDDRNLFNSTVLCIADNVIRNNSADFATTIFGKFTSINWIAMRLGGSDLGAVSYVVRFMFRDAVLNLIERVSEIGFVFIGSPTARAAPVAG